MAALHAGELISVGIANADIGGLPASSCSAIEIPVRAARDVVGPAHPGPHAEEVAVVREYQDALVRSIGHVKPTVGVERDVVREQKQRSDPATSRTGVCGTGNAEIATIAL
jgi:hypothetical protein